MSEPTRPPPNNSHNNTEPGTQPEQSPLSSVEAFSPFTRRRNEDPYFGLHLLENNSESYCYRSNPETLCNRSNQHLNNAGTSTTPPCSYNNRRVGSMWSHGYICHGFVESFPSTPIPQLVVDTVSTVFIDGTFYCIGVAGAKFYSSTFN